MNIGIDIGGTNIGAGLLDDNLDFIYKTEFPTENEKGYEFVEAKIINIIEEMILIAEKNGENIESLGIGIPGIADNSGDNIVFCPNLHWRNKPMGINLRKRFAIDINIENDATLAGIAENVLGVSRGYDNSVFITLGTGVGAGIIIDGKMYKGAHGVASELGHLIVGENFYDCNCGKNGCLETFASSTAIEKYMLREIDKGRYETKLFNRINKIEEVNAEHIFQCAAEGDELCNKAIDRMVKYLTIGITNIINILDPGIIVLGGGVSKAGSFLIDRIENLIPNYILFDDMEYADIRLAKLGNDAGIIGAAMLNQYK